MKTDSPLEGLLYDVKRLGRVVSVGLVHHFKELPRPWGRAPSPGIYEENVAHEEPYCGGSAVRREADVSLTSDDLPDETPYDPTWLHDVIVFIDRTKVGTNDLG